MSTLEIKDLQVSVATEDGAKEILKGVTLTIKDGETHAIMGPNGSGKSTLAYSIAGHPKYDVTGGSVTLDGVDVLAMSVDERARAGLFLAMQYPVEVPGVSVVQLPADRQDRARRRGSQAAHLGQGRQRGARAAQPRPDVRHPQRQRGVLRRREEAPRDRPARAAQPEDRDPRRDRLRPRHRRAQDRRRGRQPVPRPGGQGRPADHALHPDPALHRARLRARVRRRQDRRAGRARAGRAARGRGLRQVPAGRRSDRVCLVELPGSCRSWRSSARTSRSSSARSRTGSRWSTSTAPTPRRSRRSSSTRWSTTSRATTPTSPAPCTSSVPSRPRRSRRPATRWRRSSARPAATR